MPRALVVLPILLGITAPSIAFAQGEHALPMRAHTVRLIVDGEWSHAGSRFGSPTPLTPNLADGTPESLGVFFGGDSLGVTQLPWLTPTQLQLQSLTGLSGYAINLGRSRLTLETSIRRTPIRLDFAVTSRLVLGVAVPIVRSRSYAFLAGPDSTAASQGNVGFNPNLVAPGTYASFRDEVDSALIALQTQAVSGPPALQSQAQALYSQLQPFLCGLYQVGAGNAFNGSSPCFVTGSAGGAGAADFLPWGATEAGDSLTTRLGRAQTDYEALRQQYAALGTSIPGFASVYSLPATALDSNDLRRYVSDPAFPIAAETLTTVVRTGIGDIELGGWYQLAMGPRWRSQLGAVYRLGTGTMDKPDNLIDVGTGDGQADVELFTRNDVVFSPKLWLHAGARAGVQFADELQRRVAPYYMPYAPASTTTSLRRKLGSYLALDLVPNWQLDESFGVGLGYHYFHQAATTFEYVNPGDSLTIGMPASVLGQATAVTRMRVGAGVTFSTLNRYAAGRAKVPYRVTWSYQKTLYGRGGQVERSSVMHLGFEFYLSPF
jgi:hypothetical protein